MLTLQTRTQRRRQILRGGRDLGACHERAWGSTPSARLVISIVMSMLVLMPPEIEKSRRRNHVISGTCATDLHDNAGADGERLKTEFRRSDQQGGQNAPQPQRALMAEVAASACHGAPPSGEVADARLNVKREFQTVEVREPSTREANDDRARVADSPPGRRQR